MPTVLLTGTGLIATNISQKLEAKGYTVTFLSRSKNEKSAYKTYVWDIDQQKIEQEAIASADYILHLAGANISEKRWTAKRKRLLINSRVKSAELLFSEVKKQNKKLKAFLSASGVGYYGAITSDKIFTETDSPGNDFLGETCKKWEAAVSAFEDLNIRTVKIRTGVVLAKEEGALQKMLFPIKMGIGSAVGSGRQYMPWIHMEDISSIYIKAIEDDQMTGAYNAASPDHKNNKEFMKTIAKVLHKPFWFPKVPGLAMRILFGEMADILLKGSRVSVDKIQKTGFEFKFKDLETALKDLL